MRPHVRLRKEAKLRSKLQTFWLFLNTLFFKFSVVASKTLKLFGMSDALSNCMVFDVVFTQKTIQHLSFIFFSCNKNSIKVFAILLEKYINFAMYLDIVYNNRPYWCLDVRTTVPPAPFTRIRAHVGAHAPLHASPFGHQSPISLPAHAPSAFGMCMPCGDRLRPPHPLPA